MQEAGGHGVGGGLGAPGKPEDHGPDLMAGRVSRVTFLGTPFLPSNSPFLHLRAKLTSRALGGGGRCVEAMDRRSPSAKTVQSLFNLDIVPF